MSSIHWASSRNIIAPKNPGLGELDPCYGLTSAAVASSDLISITALDTRTNPQWSSRFLIRSIEAVIGCLLAYFTKLFRPLDVVLPPLKNSVTRPIIMTSNDTIPPDAILNPYTPLAFLTPDVADHYQVTLYVAVALLAASFLQF